MSSAKYLIDTNVISEIRKGERSDPHVARWYVATSGYNLFLSVLVLGEIRQGVERCRERDERKAAALERWLDRIAKAFGPRILGVNYAVAEEWGRMNATRSLPVVDSLLAATAKIHGLVLATRNVDDIKDTGIKFLNPFHFKG